MSEPAENMEEIDSFVQFPPEIRMMMIDKMEPDDRCRFGASSKLCNKDSKNSKNYIYGLELNVPNENTVGVFVRYTRGSAFGGDYSLRYFLSLEDQKKILEQTKRNFPWEINLDNSVDVLQLGIEYFKTYLKRYQNIIKSLELRGNIPENIDSEVNSLKNLEILEVHQNGYGSQFISKTHRPLKKLVITSGDIDESNLEKIYQVRDFLKIPKLKLNNEQFLRLTAHWAEIHVGKLTPEDVNNFMRSSRREDHMSHFYMRELCLTDSDFDVDEIIRLKGGLYVYQPGLQLVYLGEKKSMQLCFNDWNKVVETRTTRPHE